MIQRPKWSDDELASAAAASAAVFRVQRMQEPLEAYLDFFEKYLAVFEDLLEQTVDFAELGKHAAAMLSSSETLEAMRYLTGPPISKDDLAVLAEAQLSPAAMKRDPAIVERVLGVLRDGLDRRRFPWFTEGREPTEIERTSATIARTRIHL
jgi:hypothetical protein